MLNSLLASLLLAFFRALPICLLLPVRFNLLAVHIRLLLALMLACLVSLQNPIISDLSLGLVLIQSLIGLAVVLPFVLPFIAVEIFSDLIEMGRGVNIAGAYDPLYERQSHLAAFLESYLLMLLLSVGMLEQIVKLYIQSFNYVALSTELLLANAASSLLKILLSGLSVGFYLSLALLVCFGVVEILQAFFSKLVSAYKAGIESLIVKSLLLLAFLIFNSQNRCLEVIGSIIENGCSAYFEFANG